MRMKHRALPVMTISLLLAYGTLACGSPTTHKLTMAQVVKLANAQARAEGYNLGRFTRKDPEYDADRDEWSVFYLGRPHSEHGQPVIEFGNHFTVYVADKTRRATIIPGR